LRSGWQQAMGSKASYYPPQVMKAPLDYCGSDGLSASVESGLDGINHVVVAPLSTRRT